MREDRRSNIPYVPVTISDNPLDFSFPNAIPLSIFSVVSSEPSIIEARLFKTSLRTAYSSLLGLLLGLPECARMQVPTASKSQHASSSSKPVLLGR